MFLYSEVQFQIPHVAKDKDTLTSVSIWLMLQQILLFCHWINWGTITCSVLLSEVQCPGRDGAESSCRLVLNSAESPRHSLSPVHILVLRNPQRNPAWSLPSSLEQQLHKLTWASWVLLTDGAPPYLWQVAVINFAQGHSEAAQDGGVWELKFSLRIICMYPSSVSFFKPQALGKSVLFLFLKLSIMAMKKKDIKVRPPPL